jgi:hypothetical protein
VGLVLFSDTAQEALPPGTPARELVPFIRFFEPKRDPGATGKPNLYREFGPGAPSQTTYPLSPWYRGFSSGTQISTGLAAAREALVRDGARGGSVLLLSDLAEAREDVGRLTAELAAFRRAGIDLRVVALPPATDDELAFYRRALGNGAVVDETSVTTRGPRGSTEGFPLWLGAAALGAALAATAFLLVGLPLRWGHGR